MTADHPSQDGKAIAAIEKITIADTEHLSDSWFKQEILDGLNGADLEFIYPSTNDGEYGIVSVHWPLDDGDVLRLGNLTRVYAWGQTRYLGTKKPLSLRIRGSGSFV